MGAYLFGNLGSVFCALYFGQLDEDRNVPLEVSDVEIVVVATDADNPREQLVPK